MFIRLHRNTIKIIFQVAILFLIDDLKLEVRYNQSNEENYRICIQFYRYREDLTSLLKGIVKREIKEECIKKRCDFRRSLAPDWLKRVIGVL